jgi:polyhydroxyalkanoate synthase
MARLPLIPFELPDADKIGAAAVNLFDLLARGGLADLRPMPARIVEEAPQGTLYRYTLKDEARAKGLPLLLVPPLAAPSLCFDLRRGCSMVEHLVNQNRRTYLVDYGQMGLRDKDLGLEHWVNDVLPRAVESTLADSGEEEIHLAGWCLGGIMSLLTQAAHQLPVRSISAVASPFDAKALRIVAPIRPVAIADGGLLVTTIYRLLGTAPAPLVHRAFWLTGIDKQITKPWAIARHLDDRDWLAQLEAVDHFMANMIAYPGRTFGQLYHRFFRVNELAAGKLKLRGRTIDLADVEVPVLAVAGLGDVIAPKPAVHHVGDVLLRAPEVRLEVAPGGHLGVLAGRAARRTTWAYIDEFMAEYDE